MVNVAPKLTIHKLVSNTPEDLNVYTEITHAFGTVSHLFGVFCFEHVLCLSAACNFNTASSELIWYVLFLMHALKRSVGSPALFVKESASIRLVGTQRIDAPNLDRLWRRITMSIEVLRSSTEVGEETAMR